MEPIKMTRAEYEAKYGTAPVVSAGQNPAPTAPAPTAPAGAPVKMTRAEYMAKYGTAPVVSPYQSSPATEEKKGIFGKTKELAKGLVTAPATIAARPFQAIQGAGQYIQDKPKIDQYKKDTDAIIAENDMLVKQMKDNKEVGVDNTEIKRKIQENVNRISELSAGIDPTLKRKVFSGGVIAPAPENMKDVKKDVGRAAQTVALGLGPVSGGALFGTGSSLEQGNDLLSVETAFNTVLGAGSGKILDLVGKPLLNATGKVIGTITPETLKNVVKGGADAITKFAAQHEILPAVAKSAVKTFEKGATAIDEGVGKLFTGAGSGIRNTLAKEYPSLSTKSMQDRFLKIEQENFARPATTPGKYAKATEIYDNAKSQGTDLAKVATDNGIRYDNLIEDSKYVARETADFVRADAMKTSHDLVRPALAAAEPGVQRVPLKTVRERMLADVDKIPNSKITDAERATMRSRIEKMYGDNSAAAKAHPEGYSLTDLHDSKIAATNNGKYRPNGTMSDQLRARQYRQEGDAFRELLEENVPPELDIKEFNKAIQDKFQLADYLDELDGKKVVQTIGSKAIDFAGKIVGAKIGQTTAGGLGGIAGYHIGGILTNSFEHLPNPVKAYYLQSIEKTQPQIFKAFKEFLGEQETARLMRLQLPAKGGSSYREPGSIFYSTPKGKISSNIQEAVDINATESGSAKTPKSGRSTKEINKIQEYIQTNEPYLRDEEMPVIKSPKKTQKSLRDVYKDLPNIPF